jgi:hypothetical protein
MDWPPWLKERLTQRTAHREARADDEPDRDREARDREDARARRDLQARLHDLELELRVITSRLKERG